MGDPAGCGLQITLAAWQALKEQDQHTFYVIADPQVFPEDLVDVISQPDEALNIFASNLPVLPLQEALPAFEVGQPNTDTAPHIIESIETAVTHSLNGLASGVVTNPISKAVLYDAGFKHPGHTEFIAQLCAPDGTAPLKPVMMLVGGGLRVALTTIHMPLRDVPKHLNKELLIEIGSITHTALRERFGLADPRIAFTGLNPHAGETGTIGREEVEIINPAAAFLRAQGISISDARPADTVFHEALSGAFDAVIAMTHDQGLIPVKTLDMWGGVNTTLGLPIIRTSPDHGTAYDAARDGVARPDSLIAAIRLAADMANASLS
ncbi:4-hydroxythreonine-4-phosphate dehydrogenase PdxA [Hyphomonas sp. FCG-A18]|uniref:4-hydroxythreonine-4-phosphate dehydrogenase PdxA n=1 Tax=Hyphomonas sp. FCG-A18 TaxID=3080019 RepID=UPI002B2B3CFE|nr:4-hydroxythreonine-4-phosphate dehydrogenase PdxA [Hyphomonas sp. FCG-A18]